MKTKYDWSNVLKEVQWIATDADGVVCGYSKEPYFPKNGTIWLCNKEDEDSWICNIQPYVVDGGCANWQNSLEERPK